jgi:YHS domain-containing protein
MPRDIVCGAEVDKATPFKLEVGGRTLYFCSQGCLEDYVEREDIVAEDSEEDIRAGG